MIPLIAWGAIAAFGTFGGILYWGHERAKLKNGDTAYVPASALQLASPLAIPLKIDSLAANDLVKVENVALGPSTSIAGGTRTASGSAGKEVGISVMLKFPVSAVDTIERNGQKFLNPEKKS
jgi:hypothetical protein